MRKYDSIKACDRTISYEIIYSKKRKRAAILVRPDLRIEFRAPQGLNVDIIRKMVERKAQWIVKNLNFSRQTGCLIRVSSIPKVKAIFISARNIL